MDYDYRGIANELIQRNISLFENFDDWTKGAQALSELGKEGREIFHKIASLSSNYRKRENDRKFNNAVSTTQKVSIASFIYMCKNAGIDTNKFIIKDADFKPQTKLLPTKRPEPKPIPLCTISSEYVKRSLDMRLQSNFQAFLCKIVNDAKTIQNVCLTYALGVTKDGSTIFWQIDKDGKVRSGKIIQYDQYTGHRIKGDDGDKTDWVHSRMKTQNTLTADWTLTQCLFGAHLLHPVYMNDDKPIGLVESEKSAILCSLVFPKYVWVSCGGISNLEAGGKHEILKGRKVVMFPDTDPQGKAFSKWKKKADEWNAKGFDVTVSDILEKNATDDEKAAKIDIADWIVADLKEKYIPSPIEYITEQTEQMRILEIMMKENPNLRTLVTNLQLEIVNDPSEYI